MQKATSQTRRSSHLPVTRILIQLPFKHFGNGNHRRVRGGQLLCLSRFKRGDPANRSKQEAMKIRAATEADRDAIWEIFHEVIVAGETYPIDPDFGRNDALAYWFQPAAHAYVCEQHLGSGGTQEKQVVGAYTLHPNQAGGGAHVANAAFIVAKEARGQGIGRVA